MYLDDHQIQVDFGLSHQSAAYVLQFEQDAPAFLILNSGKGEINWDGKAISGYQLIENNTRVYLYLVPEEIPQQVRAFKDGTMAEASSAEGRNACMVLKYPQGTKILKLRYGISFIDEAQARENMEREVAVTTVSLIKQFMKIMVESFIPTIGSGIRTGYTTPSGF